MDNNVWVSSVPGSACLCIRRIIPLLLRAMISVKFLLSYINVIKQQSLALLVFSHVSS